MSTIPRRSNLGRHWNLKESTIFLNHGSFGACPREILEYQFKLRTELENDPVHFFDVTSKQLWAESIDKFSSFINADKEGLIFVPNATSGVNTILRSLDFKLGDEILKVLDSPMGSVENHEGIVIRDEKISKIPFKITGKFILGGLISDF